LAFENHHAGALSPNQASRSCFMGSHAVPKQRLGLRIHRTVQLFTDFYRYGDSEKLYTPWTKLIPNIKPMCVDFGNWFLLSHYLCSGSRSLERKPCDSSFFFDYLILLSSGRHSVQYNRPSMLRNPWFSGSTIGNFDGVVPFTIHILLHFLSHW